MGTIYSIGPSASMEEASGSYISPSPKPQNTGLAETGSTTLDIADLNQRTVYEIGTQPTFPFFAVTKYTASIAFGCNVDDLKIGEDTGTSSVDDTGEGDDCIGEETATWYTDADHDGYGDDSTGETVCDGAYTGDPNYSNTGGDCDDTDAEVNPGAEEVSGDGVDNDCNSATADEAAVDDLWSGDQNIETVAVKLSGAAAKDYAGSVAGGVDADGDGNNDVLVGAYTSDGGAGNGTAYLVMGPVSSGTLSTTGGITQASYKGDAKKDYVSYSMAMSQDYDGSTPYAAITGDGYGTYGAVLLTDLTGASGANTFSTSGILLSGNSSYPIPAAVAMGDVASNGYNASLMVGTPASGSYSTGTSDGAALLFKDTLTSSVNLNSADLIFYGGTKYQTGETLDLGDVDGDGIEDAIISSPSDAGGVGCGTSLTYDCAGSVAVVTAIDGYTSGSYDVDDATAIIEGDMVSGNLGSSTSVGEDLNEDGYQDLVIGAPYYDSDSSGNNGPGAVYLVLGKADMSTEVGSGADLASLIIYGNQEGDDGGTAEENKDVGWAVLGMDIAEYPTLLYSADSFGYGTDSDTNGEVRGLYYPAELSGVLYAYDEDSYDFILRGAASGDCLGQSLANGGDTNGDGYNDFLVGSYQTGSKAGAVYVVSGNAMGF